MIGFEDYSLSSLMLKKDEIVSLVKTLLLDLEFVKSIDKATGNTEVLNSRISTFRHRLGELMKNAS